MHHRHCLHAKFESRIRGTTLFSDSKTTLSRVRSAESGGHGSRHSVHPVDSPRVGFAGTRWGQGMDSLEEPDPGMPRNTTAQILLDCCLGPNHKATRKLEEAHPEARPATAFQGLQVLELTRARTDVGNWDYTKLTLEGDHREGSAPAAPRRTPEQTYRDFLDYEWHKLQPQDMLGGLSGTGLWTARIRVNANGDMSLHTKRLKGILFYAGPDLDATLHGRKSIRRIITEGLDLHGQAAMDEAEALKEASRRG